ncbi:MAG: hypothetical protein ACOX69_04620 [Coriobacteriales bacterium]
MHGRINQTLDAPRLNRVAEKAVALGIRKNGVNGTSQRYVHGWVRVRLDTPEMLVECKSPQEVSTRKDITMIKAVIRGYSH